MKYYHVILHLEGEETDTDEIKFELSNLNLQSATITDVHVEEIEP